MDNGQIQPAMELWGKPGTSPDPFMLMVQNNKRLGMECKYLFQRIFGIPIGQYHNILTGFDIIRFDKEIIQSPDGVSCAEAIEQKYGKEALDLISKLIGGGE
jgi:hypothetical protein